MQHEQVFDNQIASLQNYNVFDCDLALKEALKSLGASWTLEDCHAYGAMMAV